jgi:hypothetical protein
MKAQHTPGPWSYDSFGHTSLAFNDTRKDYSARIDWHTDMGGNEIDANARLIASAPDLLQVVEDYLLLCQLHDWVGAVPDAARAAIAKAKG